MNRSPHRVTRRGSCEGAAIGRMTEPDAFISLARRLGNPIAEIPEAMAVVALSELVRDLRTKRRRDLISRTTRDCLAWLRNVRVERPL
jgi:hypothetical protein